MTWGERPVNGPFDGALRRAVPGLSSPPEFVEHHAPLSQSLDRQLAPGSGASALTLARSPLTPGAGFFVSTLRAKNPLTTRPTAKEGLEIRPVEGTDYETLWELTRGHRARYAAAIVALAFSVALLFGVPLVSQAAVDRLTGGSTWLEAWVRGTRASLLLAAFLMVGLTVAGGFCHYLRGRWAAGASEAIAEVIRNRLYAHLQRLPCSYHDRVDTGDLVQRCSSDVETVRTFLAAQVVEIGRAALLLLLVIPILLWLDVGMALVSLALFPLIIVSAVVFFRRIQALFLAMDESEGRMTTVLQENLTGIRVVRAFARQEHECHKFATANGEFRDRHNGLIRLLGVFWSVSDFLCVGQIGLVLVAGAWWTAAGRLTVGELFAFLQYEALVIWPVRHMGRVLSETGKAVVALRRLDEVLRVGEEAEPRRAVEPDEIRGAIEVDGLTFAYGTGESALRDLSFRVMPGQTLALIGRPGAGKSTLIQLLLRLYDYEQGSIRLDGRELSTLARSFVRSRIGAVLQEPFLYSKTIRANLQVGSTSATGEEIAASASAACIHDAIEGFERGYDTMVGERGVTLSGGQRQRMAIARALLKDPAILILDDALSALDAGTERRVLEALRTRSGRRTTIVIAHRLSSVMHADRILVLERGAIVQAGTHAELSRTPGPYRRLFELQDALEEELLGLRAARGEAP